MQLKVELEAAKRHNAALEAELATSKAELATSKAKQAVLADYVRRIKAFVNDYTSGRLHTNPDWCAYCRRARARAVREQ